MDGVLTVICSASYLIAVRAGVTALSMVTFSAVAQDRRPAHAQLITRSKCEYVLLVNIEYI